MFVYYFILWYTARVRNQAEAPASRLRESIPGQISKTDWKQGRTALFLVRILRERG